MWGYVAGIYTYTNINNLHNKSVVKAIGIEISEYTKDHARKICELQKQLDQNERDLALLIQSDEFEPYMKVFQKFGFGLRNQALLLCQCYPFDRFLLDGKIWVDYEEGMIVDIREDKRELFYLVEFADSDGCEFVIAYLKANEFITLQYELAVA